jgi:Sec-independent protein translocase protein TatA
MFDISFAELFAILVVAIVVLSPKDVPKVLYGLGRIVRRLNYMRFSLSQQFDSFMDAHSGGDPAASVNFETRKSEPLRPFPPSADDGVIERAEESFSPALLDSDPKPLDPERPPDE